MPSGLFGTVKVHPKNKYKVKKVIPAYTWLWRVNDVNNPPKKEFEIAKIMGKEGLGPTVHDTKISLFKSTMKMNKMNGTLLNMAEADNLSRKDMEQIVGKLVKLHKIGYYHGDIHRYNIMFTSQKNSKDWKFIDFGRTKKITQKLNYDDVLHQILVRDDRISRFLTSIPYGFERDLLNLHSTLNYADIIQNEAKHKTMNNPPFYHYSRYKFDEWFFKTVKNAVSEYNNNNTKRRNK